MSTQLALDWNAANPAHLEAVEGRIGAVVLRFLRERVPASREFHAAELLAFVRRCARSGKRFRARQPEPRAAELSARKRRVLLPGSGTARRAPTS